MPVSWVPDGQTLYGISAGDRRRYLVVEPLPDEFGWDWISWEVGQNSGASVVTGRARTVREAVIEAEASASAELTQAAGAPSA